MRSGASLPSSNNIGMSFAALRFALKINTIPLSRIGTDYRPANVLAPVTVDTAGTVGGHRHHTPGMGLDATICIGEQPPPQPAYRLVS